MVGFFRSLRKHLRCLQLNTAWETLLFRTRLQQNNSAKDIAPNAVITTKAGTETITLPGRAIL
jgi:hypothetical protein